MVECDDALVFVVPLCPVNRVLDRVMVSCVRVWKCGTRFAWKEIRPDSRIRVTHWINHCCLLESTDFSFWCWLHGETANATTAPTAFPRIPATIITIITTNKLFAALIVRNPSAEYATESASVCVCVCALRTVNSHGQKSMLNVLHR